MDQRQERRTSRSSGVSWEMTQEKRAVKKQVSKEKPREEGGDVGE